MAEDMGDKTEAPTPRRRLEAREQGNIPRSADLTSSVLLIGAMFLLKTFGGNVFAALGGVVNQMLGKASLSSMDPGELRQSMAHAAYSVGMAMAPMLAGVMIIACAVNIAQSGLHFNAARLTPNIMALNPFKGLSRLFGKGQGTVKFGMSVLKLFMVGATAYSAVHGRLGEIVLAQELSFMQVFGVAGSIVFSISFRIGVLLFVLSIADYFWQRRRIEQSLKMTKVEVKDEMRSMEGDPKIKARRRQIALQRIREQLKKDVPKADVVVTNPTEFAVALQYDPGKMNAPRVIAKGQGFMAARIRELAIENGIPILERKPLARALYKLCEVGQEVPEQFFNAVAEILAYVYELNGRFKRKHFSEAA